LPLEIGPKELMDDASQEAHQDDQMVQSQAPQADHRDVSVTLPQVPQSHQQNAQNISEMLLEIYQVDQQDANGSMQHPDAEADIPSSNQATRCKCDAATNHQDVHVFQTSQMILWM
jgi:hypothetical protein